MDINTAAVLLVCEASELPAFDFAASLSKAGFAKIIVTLNGKASDAAGFSKIPGCELISCGGGRGHALKAGFTALQRCENISCVITVPAGCSAEMLAAFAGAIGAEEQAIAIGTRDFSAAGVPKSAARGSRLCRALLRTCCGIRLSDPQFRLRAYPASLLSKLCEIPGDRTDYETNVLLQMKRQGAAFREIAVPEYPTEAFMRENRPLLDAWNIIRVVVRFMLSSLGSTLLDLLLFSLAYSLLRESAGAWAEMASTVIARIISSFFNFNMNNKAVFGNSGSYRQALLRYYCLCIPQMLVSAGLVTLLNRLIGNSLPALATLIKAVVDTVLFFISFGIQREWVFAQKKKK